MNSYVEMVMEQHLLDANQGNLDYVVADQANMDVHLWKSKSALPDSSMVDRDSSTVAVT